SVALALARVSRHPLSQALAAHLQESGVRPTDVDDIREIPGMGMEARCDGVRVRLGKPSWAGAKGATDEALACGFGIDGRVAHLLRFADRLRPDAGDAIARLASMGLDSVILSGDRHEAVAPISEKLHISAAFGMTPDDKVQAIARLGR